jgi:ParB-like chromosome segregation protein Spo0J
MSTTTHASSSGALTVALDRIHVPVNVRALDIEHVDALAGSIGLQGLLVPVVLTAARGDVATGGWTYQLVAGFHRLAAVAKLGHAEIAAVIRDGET